MNQKTLLPSPNRKTLHTTLLMLGLKYEKSQASLLTAEAIHKSSFLKNNSNKSLIAQNLESVDVTFKWVQIGHGHATDKEQLASGMLGVFPF